MSCIWMCMRKQELNWTCAIFKISAANPKITNTYINPIFAVTQIENKRRNKHHLHKKRITRSKWRINDQQLDENEMKMDVNRRLPGHRPNGKIEKFYPFIANMWTITPMMMDETLRLIPSGVFDLFLCVICEQHLDEHGYCL